MLSRYFYTIPTMTDSQLNTLESWVPASKPAVRTAVDEHYHRQPLYHEVPFTYDVQSLQAQGVRYVVLSSAHYHNIDPQTEDRFYADLAHRGKLVGRFNPPVTLPDADHYPVSMPTITIYELPR
jgi:hypothetical protein